MTTAMLDKALDHCFTFINAPTHDKRKGRHFRRAIEIVGETKAKRLLAQARETQKLLGIR